MLNDFSEYKRYFICKHGNDIQMCVRDKGWVKKLKSDKCAIKMQEDKKLFNLLKSFDITTGDWCLPVKCIKHLDIFLAILVKTFGQNCTLIINKPLLVYEKCNLLPYFLKPWWYYAETNAERTILKPPEHPIPSFIFPIFSSLPFRKHVFMEDKNLHHSISQAFCWFSENI